MSAAKDGVMTGDDGVDRCWWCGAKPLYRSYHDHEWGIPDGDDQRLFEGIVLDGFQAGLSWYTILSRREHFREAFADFDVERVARLNTRSVDRLLRNDRIIRHRGKIESAINNARRAIELIEKRGSLAAHLWSFEPAAASRPRTLTKTSLPATSPESVAMSKDLKARGWTFVGPTILYAFMQSAGIVNDHLTGCRFRSRVEGARRAFARPAIR